MAKSKKLSPERELIVSHFVATTAAFQSLTICLQNEGVLKRGAYQEQLLRHAELLDEKDANAAADLLRDLRDSLLN